MEARTTEGGRCYEASQLAGFASFPMQMRMMSKVR